MQIYWILWGLIIWVITLLYIRYKMSDYSKVSKHSFFLVHTWLFLNDWSKLIRYIFQRYLWLYHEYSVYNILSGVSGYWKILINLYLPQWKNVTDTEVDLLFIHESGIFCVEAKDYSGYILWKETDQNWMQMFWKRNKFPFHNPIYQNYSHRKSLENIIPDYAEKIIPIIVFSNKSKLNINCPHNIVLQSAEVKKWFKNRQDTLLTTDEIEKITLILEKYRTINPEKEYRHDREVQLLQNT